MSSTTTSINAFIDQLREELAEIRQRWNLNESNECSGYAFALWYAALLMKSDFGLEGELEEVVLRGGGDLGVDIVLSDETNQTLVIVQCKFRGDGRSKKSINPEEVDAFLPRCDQLRDPAYIRKGNEDARELLRTYAEQLDHGWKAKFHFVTTADSSERVNETITRRNAEIARGDFDIEYVLIDRERLRLAYDRSLSLEASIPDEVEIDLPEGQFIEVPGPMECLIAAIKGNELRNQYNRKGRKESLFAWNIRNYLGDRGINKSITRTATENSDKFFYYNNGVTAVCKDYELDGNKLKIKKFQIINGAQTVGSIAAAPDDERVRVIFRLIKTGKVDTEVGINSEIINANNTQNAIKISDFRSNDRIQQWLQENIGQYPSTETLGKLAYKPKRGNRKLRADRVLDLEEFAKIRYAYLNVPWRVHADPRSLWTLASQQGVYDYAFGIDGTLLENWSTAVLRESLLAIAFHDAAVRSAKQERESAPDITYMYRLRFHAVGLAGAYMRGVPDAPNPRGLLEDKAEFGRLWDLLWSEIRRILFYHHEQFVIDADGSLFALVRSPEAWSRMLKMFRFAHRIPEAAPQKAEPSAG